MTRSTTGTPRSIFAGRPGGLLHHVPSFARLCWRLFRDRRVPLAPKALLVLTAVYLLSPLDVVPELIPIVGAMDDVAVAVAGVWVFIRLCPPLIVREHVAAIAAATESRG